MAPRGRPRKGNKKEEVQQQLPTEEPAAEEAAAIATLLPTGSNASIRRRKPPALNASEGTLAPVHKKIKSNELDEECHLEVPQQQPADVSALTTFVAKEVMAVNVVGDGDFCKLSLVEDNSFVVATAAAVAAHQEFAAACKVAKENNNKSATEGAQTQQVPPVTAVASNQQDGTTLTLRASKKRTKPMAKTSSSTSAAATTRWNQKYEELKAYHEKHGHVNIPLRFPENQPLATWISQQREQFKILEKQTKCTPIIQEHIFKLQQLGFQWTVTTEEETSISQSPAAITSPTSMNNNKTTSEDHDDEFQARLAELLTYKKEHGDLLVPPKYAPNIKLGAWVKHQKNQYKLYKEGNTSSSQLTSHRVKLLEDVGFVWPLPTKLDHKWSSRLQELKKFQQIHKHCRVPDKYSLNPQLATWVRHISKRMLTAYPKYICISHLGTYDVPHYLSWYVLQVSTQRVQFRLYKEGKKGCMITPSRIKALDEIGFDWGREGCSDLVDWEVRYEELRLFHEENGHCRVPRAYKENQQLGNWVHTQVKLSSSCFVMNTVARKI